MQPLFTFCMSFQKHESRKPATTAIGSSPNKTIKSIVDDVIVTRIADRPQILGCSPTSNTGS
jgi:hypothetical protein